MFPSYILHTLYIYSLYFVFLLTAVPCPCWSLTTNRQGQIFQLWLVGELCHLRMWLLHPWDQKHQLTSRRTHRPWGGETRRTCAESPGMLKNLIPQEWHWRCVGHHRGWHQQGASVVRLHIWTALSVLALHFPGLYWNGHMWFLQSST